MRKQHSLIEALGVLWKVSCIRAPTVVTFLATAFGEQLIETTGNGAETTVVSGETYTTLELHSAAAAARAAASSAAASRPSFCWR